MPTGNDIAEPQIDERQLPRWDEDVHDPTIDPYIVILYNDDYHSIDEVIGQLQKATGYPLEQCIQITLEAHIQGRAIAYTGGQEECERVARVLRQIRLQVETDRF